MQPEQDNVRDIQAKQLNGLIMQLMQAERLNVRGKTAGSANLGNTCYMNAVLQMLFHMKPRVKWSMQNVDELQSLHTARKAPLTYEFFDLIPECQEEVIGRLISLPH